MTATATTERMRVGQQVRVTLPAWLQNRNNLFSRVLEGEVLAVTERAIQFKGRAAVMASQWCMRCGRAITNPASIEVGYGPDCAKEVHVYHKGRLDPTDAESVRRAISNMEDVTLWLPLSQISTEVVRDVKHDAAKPQKQERTRVDARFTVENGRIVCRTRYEHRNRCKSVPGARWDAKSKAWTYPVSPAIAESLSSAFRGLSVFADEQFQTLQAASVAVAKAQEHKSAHDLPPVPVSKTDAWLHQRQAFWFVASMWGLSPDDVKG